MFDSALPEENHSHNPSLGDPELVSNDHVPVYRPPTNSSPCRARISSYQLPMQESRTPCSHGGLLAYTWKVEAFHNIIAAAPTGFKTPERSVQSEAT